MNECILNLGPFNDCVDVLEDGCVARYGPLGGDVVSCFSGKGDICEVGVLTGSDDVTIPMLTLGLAADKNTQKNRQKLIGAIELKVLGMIYYLASKCEIELNLSNVVIPIKSVVFKLDGRKRLCITAVLGVAMFEGSMTRILVQAK
ncbi:hypothetical protein LCGC14_0426540 [marine sediment metagenome]|uniref:Uncharacterized protein n=1 Tax=marine sediment metagenome TaxID=412755 RepID=A0A0F9VBF2_9ZZZZ